MATNNNPLTIIYCGNDKIFDGFLFSSLSVALSTTRPLRFYVMTADLTSIKPVYQPFRASHAQFAETTLRQYHPDLQVKILDCTHLYWKIFPHMANARTIYTPYIVLRLLVEYFPELGSKALYLDTDTVAMDDIAPLYDIELGEADVGMVLDAVGHYWLGKHYCNSGVLLMAIDSIRRSGSFRKACDMVNRIPLLMPDQTAINCKTKGKCLILPARYNEQFDIRPNTVIRHYCKRFFWFPYLHFINIKPWNMEAFHAYYGSDIHKELFTTYLSLRTKMASSVSK